MRKILILIPLALVACSPANVDYVKERADAKWAKQGYEVVDYEGYQWGIGGFSYGGANVWYRLKKNPDNGRTYSGHLQRWGDELHVYGPDVNDANEQFNINVK